MMDMVDPRFSLEGKVAIVTGAAGGQGQFFVSTLLQRGCAVVATDINPSVLATPEAAHERCQAIEHDVSSNGAWEAACAVALSCFGKIDVLVNNAGFLAPASLVETDAASFERHYRINQLGTFLGMANVAPLMVSAGQGSIINIASVGAMRGFAGEFAYCTTKWAIRGMTRCAAIELGPSGVRVNAICPGPVDTPMLGASDERDEWAKHVPVGRLGRPADIAGLVAFLASEEALYLNGAELVVDGGMIA
jgi:3alpha(or 20beta)-hydroxysteroid dehydrogenase